MSIIASILGCVNFADNIVGIILIRGRQKQRAKCLYNRSKFELINYNSSNIGQGSPSPMFLSYCHSN